MWLCRKDNPSESSVDEWERRAKNMSQKADKGTTAYFMGAYHVEPISNYFIGNTEYRLIGELRGLPLVACMSGNSSFDEMACDRCGWTGVTREAGCVCEEADGDPCNVYSCPECGEALKREWV